MLTAENLDESAILSLSELCHACSAHAEWVVELVEEGVIEPEGGPEPSGWRFYGTSLRRARVARRLQSDLGINLNGAAVVLELLEEIEVLRLRLSESRGPAKK